MLLGRAQQFTNNNQRARTTVWSLGSGGMAIMAWLWDLFAILRIHTSSAMISHGQSLSAIITSMDSGQRATELLKHDVTE